MENISGVKAELHALFLSFSVSQENVRYFITECVTHNDASKITNQAYLENLVFTGKGVLEQADDIPRKQLKSLCAEISEALNVEIDTNELDSGWVRFLRTVRVAMSAIIFVFVCYLILGAIWDGYSNLSAALGRFGIYSCLFILILVLAALEGTQLSVTILKLKDLEKIRQDYPRSYKLQKLFKTDLGTKKYLAGRQMMVIIIVFCIAQILSFPNIEKWPLTSTKLPDFFFPVFHLVFFKLGILGAIFVLWFGQLIPQFISASNPQKFLNWPGMGAVLKIAWLSESLGITHPVDWVTNKFPPGEHISPSTKELFFETSENLGYSINSIIKNVRVSSEAAEVETESVLQILSDNARMIVDDSITFVADNLVEIDSESTDAVLIRDGELCDSTAIQFSHGDSKDNHTGISNRIIQVTSSFGYFERGDIIKITNLMKFKKCDSADISIKSPTRYSHIRIEILDQPKEVDIPTMVFHEWDAMRKGFAKMGANTLELDVHESGEAFQIEHTLLYPKLSTKYSFHWEVNY